MFTIDSEAHVNAYPDASAAEPEDSGTYIHSKTELAALISAKPGEWAVMLWNQLPGVTPIHTPPGESAAKFRNKQTAVERIWQKLCELYPDAIPSKDMPQMKELKRHAAKGKAVVARAQAKTQSAVHGSANGTGRKSRWAEELTEALRKRFNPGDSFGLPDVYKLIPQFQRRHPDNKNVAARLRATLAQDLRGRGIVKSSAKGKYRLAAA